MKISNLHTSILSESRKIFNKINFIQDWYKLKKINSLLMPLKDKKGLEIGGISSIFNEKIPIYELAEIIDGCNFSNNTIWEGQLLEGPNYKYYKNKVGMQYISEGTDLHYIEDEQYDFAISSHCLEHIANPIKALKTWRRVVKKGGLIIVIVPEKKYTFDHRRSVTTFSHLLDDYKNNMDEKDLTHLDEILQYHDLSRDIRAGNLSQFKERCLKNFINRAMHHHVFDLDVMKKLFNYCKISTIHTTRIRPFHQIIVGKRL
jgi:SAM-dependent methyltransferase